MDVFVKSYKKKNNRERNYYQIFKVMLIKMKDKIFKINN